MARLQWTPIVAQDTGESALRAQQVSGAALQQALAGFGGILDQYEGQRREANLAELYARQNAFAEGNNVAGYSGALADGSLTKGLNFLKASDIASARGFTNELRTGRNAETTFEREGIRWDQGQADRARGESERLMGNKISAELIGLRTEAQRTGDMSKFLERADQIVKSNPNITSGMIDNIYATGRQGVQDYRGDVNFADGRQDRQWAVEDRTDRRDAQSLVQPYINSGATAEELVMDPAFRKANAQVQAMALSAMGGFGGGGGTGGGGSVGGGAGGAVGSFGAPQQAVSSTLSSLGASPAAIAGLLGNFEVEGGYGGALGDGGSASGIAQWRGPRREAFRQRFGKEPHQATHEEQARFVAWELLSPEGRRISGVTEAQARQIWNATDPGQAADLIDRYYERSNGKHRDRRIAAANSFAGINSATAAGQGTSLRTGAAVASNADQYGPQARNIANALADDRPVREVINEVVGEGGALQGMDRGRMGRMIREVQDRYSRNNGGGRLSPAAATQVLLGSMTQFDGGKDFFTNLIGRTSPVGSTGGMFATATDTVQWNKVDDLLTRMTGRDGDLPLADDVRRQDERTAIMQNAAAGQQAIAAAEANLRLAVQRGAPQHVIASRQQQLQAAREQWGTFAGGAVRTLDASGVYGQPAPAPRRPVATGPQRSFVNPAPSRPQRSLYVPQ